MPRFPRLTRLFRSQPALEPAALETYAEAVAPTLASLAALFERWRESLQIDSRDDLLADASSIQRWEAAGLRDRLRQAQPPDGLANLHAELISIATSASRASQLLSSGYRFHSSRARCDGHALLLTAQERFATARAELIRHGLVIEPSSGHAGSG